MKSKNSILGIDRGSKYVGVAYVLEGESITMPVGYLMNDKMLLFSLADLVMRHHANTIVVGFPKRQKDVQEKIQKFVTDLRMVINPEIEIDFEEEDYTSVQSGEIVSNFKKNVAEDTVSAMLILERWLKRTSE